MQFSELFLKVDLPEPLSKEELDYYFRKMESGDLHAREEIINRNIKFVIYEVRRMFSNTSYSLEDLISIGLIGLIKSVDTFDIDKKVLFLTYSKKCILNEILMFIRKNKINEVLVPDVNNDEVDDFIDDLQKEELYEIIKTLVEELSYREKSVVIKYFGFIDKPMRNREIAEELGIPIYTVSKILSRSLKKIRIQLELLDLPKKMELKKDKN